MKRLTKLVLGAGGLGGIVAGGLFAYALYDGPRMKVQPHFRAYQSVMALPPPGSVPAEEPSRVPGQVSAKAPATGSSERGAVYYGYFCLPCHGADGRGGPVGESYHPAPPDLTRLQLAPAALHAAMLAGIGHEPVLERVVRTEYRWDLVAFVRTLAGNRQQVQPAAETPGSPTDRR